MSVLRRILAALVLSGLAAGALRLRGRGGVPPQHGGWREVDPDSVLPDAAGGVARPRG